MLSRRLVPYSRLSSVSRPRPEEADAQENDPDEGREEPVRDEP